jgi:hypothetical protein
MSSETIYKYSTQVTGISGTTSAASNAFNGSTEVTALNSANHGKYPNADAVLFASFSTSVSSNSCVVNLYRRDINIDSTNDAPQPQSASPAYSNAFVGAFIIPPFTAASTAYIPMPDVPLAAECEFYIENKTNATMVSGYTVKFTPKTVAPAP